MAAFVKHLMKDVQFRDYLKSLRRKLKRSG